MDKIARCVPIWTKCPALHKSAVTIKDLTADLKYNHPQTDILILTAKYGMGHYTTSMSLKQELENENISVKVVDFFEIIFPKIKTIIYNIFNLLVSKCSTIYNFFYKFSTKNNMAPFKKIIKKRIDKLIQENNADIIISTFPVCSKYISAYKKMNNTDIRLYTYVTDVEVNKEWLTDETDAYFVASIETKNQMLNYGIPENKINVVGIPVRKEFKEKIYAKSKNEIVIMGGGLGLIPNMEKTISDLMENENIHITLLTGKNQKLFEKYNNKYTNMTVIGYTNEVYKYMKKAELIVTKPGGITLFEAIYSKTPIYVLNPFLSQEIGNAKFIENNGIGKVVWDKKEDVTQDILDLLGNQTELKEMRDNMQEIKSSLEKLTVLDIYRKASVEIC